MVTKKATTTAAPTETASAGAGATRATTVADQTASSGSGSRGNKRMPSEVAAPAETLAPTKRASPVEKTTALAIDAVQLQVKDGEEPWTQAEVEEILEELEAQRVHSLAVLEAQEEELSGLMRNPGDGAGQDQADVGSSSFERDQELTVVNSEREKLDQIERALQSLQEGTYGICESCGEPIGKMRLLAFPRATLCVTCKTREERR